MISPHENKSSPPPSLWSFILDGNNARSLLDELIELGLCYLLSSRAFSNLINHMHGLLLGYVLLELQKLQNFLGLFKVLLPIVFFILARVLRFLLQHHKHYCTAALRRFRILVIIERGVGRIVGFSQHFGCQCGQFLGKIFRNFDSTLRKWKLDKFEKML